MLAQHSSEIHGWPERSIIDWNCNCDTQQKCVEFRVTFIAVGLEQLTGDKSPPGHYVTVTNSMVFECLSCLCCINTGEM